MLHDREINNNNNGCKQTINQKEMYPSLKLPIYLNVGGETPINGKPSVFPSLRSVVALAPVMSNGEDKEYHLQEALSKKSAIPIPEVIEIDENIYDKLYPANVVKQKGRIHWIPSEDKLIEYDADSCDLHWLQEQPKEWQLTVELLEDAFEFLETNCDRRVPKLEELRSHMCLKDIAYEAETAMYDYWIDKRLKEKTRLTFLVKTCDNKQRNKRSILGEDPYVAFRNCVEKMHTRRNRSIDHDSYMEMLRIRRQLALKLKLVKAISLDQKVNQEMIKLKLAVFKAQYTSKAFNLQQFFEPPNVTLAKDFDFFKYSNPNDEVAERQSRCSTRFSVSDDFSSHEFTFERKAGCEYYKPKSTDDNHDDSDMKKELRSPKFTSTTKGVLRKRIGRGGRIVYDRLSSSTKHLSGPEYKQWKLLHPKILCKRIDYPSSGKTGFDAKILKDTHETSVGETLELELFDRS